MATPEAKFQKKFIDDLREQGFKCIRVKASGNSNKGIPDYAIFYGFFWAWLEFKKSKNAEVQPGQRENVEWAFNNSFGAFVYPENSNKILNQLLKYKKDVDKIICD